MSDLFVRAFRGLVASNRTELSSSSSSSSTAPSDLHNNDSTSDNNVTDTNNVETSTSTSTTTTTTTTTTNLSNDHSSSSNAISSSSSSSFNTASSSSPPFSLSSTLLSLSTLFNDSSSSNTNSGNDDGNNSLPIIDRNSSQTSQNISQMRDEDDLGDRQQIQNNNNDNDDDVVDGGSILNSDSDSTNNLIIGTANNNNDAIVDNNNAAVDNSGSTSTINTNTTTTTTTNTAAANHTYDNRPTLSVTMNLTFNVRHRHHDPAVRLLEEINGVETLDPLLFRTRHRIYSMLLVRAAVVYCLTVPSFVRRFFEYFVLVAAIVSFALLIHLHIIFIRSPLTCLDHVKVNWPRDGILRVQIGSDSDIGKPTVTMSESAYSSSFSSSMLSSSISLIANCELNKQCNSSVYDNNTLNIQSSQFIIQPQPQPAPPLKHSISNQNTFPLTYQEYRKIIESSETWRNNLKNIASSYDESADDASLSSLKFFSSKKNGGWSEPYVVEYSLEYGLLRLSEEMRRHYKVPVMTVTLLPAQDVCFGDPMARYMLRIFLGYDDVLIGSIKRLAENENNRGYVRNVVTGEHFRFVNVWMTRASYLAAAFIMIVFTLFVSMLIRYSHQQVFVFISEFLRTLEMQQPFSRITFLAASLITVILALIGMEAIMYEFFADSSIAFHVIIMVWAADQFDSMAVRSPISRRHFLRFFYLYQFIFYAYHYRFNGQYAGLALLTTMLFTYHSMIYFFHHFELPLFQAIAMGQNLNININHNNNNNNNNNNNDNDDDNNEEDNQINNNTDNNNMNQSTNQHNDNNDDDDSGNFEASLPESNPISSNNGTFVTSTTEVSAASN